MVPVVQVVAPEVEVVGFTVIVVVPLVTEPVVGTQVLFVVMVDQSVFRSPLYIVLIFSLLAF